MGFFDFFKQKDINSYLKEYKKDKNSILLDVRTEDEFKIGKIPESVTIPLDNLNNVESILKDKNKKIYVYCRSGARAAKAKNILNEKGYDAINIGGILDYKGKIEK
ncbi:MAG: rhodanese-like domain-containing protein [Peptoniphilaceae bacterium]|nr:rhodanese-like domain-containing protein [Peptoniphilaceae bacterium]